MGGNEEGVNTENGGDAETIAALEGLSLPDDEAIKVDDIGQVESGPVDHEAARRSARSIVGLLQGLFSMLSGGWFRFAQSDYDDAEERIAPALEKYSLAESGPLKYAPEIDAIMCGGGLIFRAIGTIKAAQQEPEESDKPTEPGYQQSASAEAGKDNGNKPGSFTTQ
ncbi:MAG: hypothetical protein JKY34_06160 [Kordiimonadaceae bacterium]|nr:hypothetical protein [Kordiimonadaceae bacterium]PCJ37697.1 MAG: hypothetical protein COA75_02975 [Cellvibrionales bacterium]